MQLHLTAHTSNAFLLNVIRENSLTFDALTSDYVFRFDALQSKESRTVTLADQSPSPAHYQAFDLDLTAYPLEVGDHIYRVSSVSGSSGVLMSGFATVRGPVVASTAFTQGDSSTIIAYE